MSERWVDTHVHLERYAPEERARMLADARDAGVVRMVAVSTSMESSRRTLALAGSAALAVGVHPTRAAEIEADELARMAANPAVVAIGEAGFDGTGPPLATQRRAFAIQARIARELHLPLVLHIDGDGAWEAFQAAEREVAGVTVVRHYFRGDPQQLEWHAARGHYISFGRPLLRDERLQELARSAPGALLLIETDSYPLPGRATAPRDVVEVGVALARARGEEVATLSAQLWTNTLAAFGSRFASSLAISGGAAEPL